MTEKMDFLKELKNVRGTPKPAKAKFEWDKNLATPKSDQAHPTTNLSATPTDRPKPLKTPAKDLPRTTNGQLDLPAIRSDVETELKKPKRRQA